MQKIECSSLAINGHLNNTNSKNKDLMDIPNQKTLVNHVRIATFMPVESKEIFKSKKHIKESLMVTKEHKLVYEQTSPKPELLLNNDIYEKEKSNKTLTFNTRRRTDNINNTSTFSVK